jgi:hypothetical protein
MTDSKVKANRSNHTAAEATRDAGAAEATKAEAAVVVAIKEEEAAAGVATRAEAGQMSLGRNPSLLGGTKAMNWLACPTNNVNRCVTCEMAATISVKLVRLRANMEASTSRNIIMHHQPSTHCRHTRHPRRTLWAHLRPRRLHHSHTMLEPSTSINPMPPGIRPTPL